MWCWHYSNESNGNLCFNQMALKPYDGWTNKFIFPPYEFSVPNCMVSNLHLPLSSLMMMVSAFAGYDFLMKAYKEAIAEKYKFFTYGDAMLIL